MDSTISSWQAWALLSAAFAALTAIFAKVGVEGRALKLGPATLVAPIDKLSVVMVALFGVALLGERPSPTGWLGIVLVGAGAILIAVKG